MKLFVLPGSPNCRKVLAVIKYLNLSVEIETIKGFESLRTPEYLALNLNGKVPTLVDGDDSIWESNAIMIHLATKYDSQTELFPEKQRIDILRWLFWELTSFNLASGKVAWELIAKPMFKMGDANMNLVEEGSEEFHRYAPVLEKRLSDGRKFISGEEVTLSDFATGRHAAFFQIGIKEMDNLLNQYPNILAWYQRLNEVPAWKETFPPWLNK